MQKKQIQEYQVAVIGAGHAGIEAAVAAARLGAKTALFTLSLDAIANLPCNPSIGGTAKGHLVREIDALGGCMGLAADHTLLQSRMLNKGKGPAVQSLRVQTDRAWYHLYMKELIESTPGLELIQAEVVRVNLRGGAVKSLLTRSGDLFGVQAVIVACGTYLSAVIHMGDHSYSSGPDGIAAAGKLSDALRKLGLPIRRFKTGTPARVHSRTLDFSRLEEQPGDEPIIPFSPMTKGQLHNRMICHLAYTNEDTHEIIRKNLHRSALYSGKIEGVGPRYCPSIEDKIVRFADKNRHTVFVEPCGLHTREMYLQGLSTSLPLEVQIAMYRSIAGMEQVEIMRPAYAIEYDCIDPLALQPTLETKAVAGLYGAGQFNGTSGYEEAAGQGLLAGVNAARLCQGKEPLILSRQQSYIGTMIDDLVTKGTEDPYRMLTSRSEYRLFLRQDNAEERLTPLGRAVGLVDDNRWRSFQARRKYKQLELARLSQTQITPALANNWFASLGLEPLRAAQSAADLLKRPQIGYEVIAPLIGPGRGVNAAMGEQIQIEIRYKGYIDRQLIQIEKLRKMESTSIPQDFCYTGLDSLSLEAREKLEKVRPKTLGQASRVPGVSSSDLSQLALYLIRLVK